MARVAAAHSLARLTRHGEMVAQQRSPTLRIGKATVALPPAAFLQATAAGETTLARIALAYCAGAKAVADLFCGIGPFALRLAAGTRVVAVDADEAADERLRVVELHRERVVVRRSVRGIRMALNMPVAAYRGVAIRLSGETGKAPTAITVMLEHRATPFDLVASKSLVAARRE